MISLAFVKSPSAIVFCFKSNADFIWAEALRILCFIGNNFSLPDIIKGKE